MRNLYAIKSQDILLLLKLIIDPDETQKELAGNLSISQTEISLGLRRLANAGLLTSEGQASREASFEFLVSGLKYVFPPEFGTLSAGVPTSFAKPGFKFVKYNKDQVYVWPYPEGTVRGIVLKPIHPSFPEACLKNDKLYTLAALVEMIRSGKAREKSIATKELSKIIRNT